MIIDITIANFRSIKEKQTISLCAESTPRHLKNNIAFPGDGKIGVLKSCGVYGANASGKSNLLLAFEALRYIICRSGDLKDGDEIPCYEPFKLSASEPLKPVEFEIEFFGPDARRFLYAVSFDSNSIITESLDFYPGRIKANLFKREEGDSWQDIKFGTHYKGGKKRVACFRNNSYLSKAGNSADASEVIQGIYNYFRKDIFHLGAGQQVAMFDWKDDSEIVQKISKLLCHIDTGIVEVEFKDSEFDDGGIDFSSSVPEPLRKKILKDRRRKAYFSHKDQNGGVVKFTEEMESSGTVKLFNTLPLLLEAFEYGGVLLLDELDNSFHPHVVEFLISLFNSSEVNTNNAQLIFTTHNINLMSPNLLRRDQIWFVEKENGASLFHSLDEYDKSKVKSNSPFRKWYEEGRFGAIPRINKEKISEILRHGAS
ncbi:ATP-binding protein [Exilibacterium tricleocarpae]|uniref:ATP-binding protein n=1 Tax=Exilibacterium tricleocarpae TaxID=2591008 RepID=A0A545U5R5_9GAMM|nr:ATP-binding protein [Exilibacterium tricleocarpae]TQV84814.1 ATP-binding protein [Exilibacterium tricleocarpae]